VAVGGVGDADGELFGVELGLGDALGGGEGFGFGFDDGEPGVAVDEDVVCDFRKAALASAHETALGDAGFAHDA